MWQAQIAGMLALRIEIDFAANGIAWNSGRVHCIAR
jgi:phosphatidylserine decarboxylase